MNQLTEWYDSGNYLNVYKALINSNWEPNHRHVLPDIRTILPQISDVVQLINNTLHTVRWQKSWGGGTIKCGPNHMNYFQFYAVSSKVFFHLNSCKFYI